MTGVLLLVGLLLLVPVTAIVVARTRRKTDEAAAWRGGYLAGLQDADALVRGERPRLMP